MSTPLYVYSQPRPQTSLAALTSTPQTFIVNMQGFDTLILDVALTRVAATATIFSFTGKSTNGNSDYGITVTDYAAKTLTDGTFTYTSSSTYAKRFVFSLPALGVVPDQAGNITVSISTTAGTTDSVTINPTVARVN